MLPQSAEIAPAKMIDAFLFAKSIQAIWPFSSGSLTYWTIGTILLLEHSYSFFSKANGLISSQLFQWLFSSSTCPTISELSNLPSPSHLPMCSPGLHRTLPQVFPIQHRLLFIIQICLYGFSGLYCYLDFHISY